jgi:hypothetical protein
MRWGVKFGMAPEVMRITKSLEFTLVLTGRWDAWTNALCLAAQSATAAGDKAGLGWVRHQDGTKAICEGNFTEGRQSLERALQIREELRDKAGADVTRHNLKLVAPPTIPTWNLWKLLAGLGAVICAVIVAVLVASKFHLWLPLATPAPTITSITTPAPASATPAPPVTSITTPAPAPVTPVLAVSVATPPQAVAPLAPTIAPAGTTTTTLPVTPVTPSITPNIPLNPELLARIVRFTGTPTTVVRGESAKLSYKLENAEHASIDPSVGEVDLVEGNFRVSPGERTTYTLTVFGRDGVAERQRVTIDVQSKRPTGSTREASKKRDMSSPTPGPRVRESSGGTRSSTAPSGQRGSLQIGIGGSGVRIPIGAGTRAPTATPAPRPKVQIGIGRGYNPDRP